MFSFICDPCKTAADAPKQKTPESRIYRSILHQSCKGITHCNCQHKVR